MSACRCVMHIYGWALWIIILAWGLWPMLASSQNLAAQVAARQAAGSTSPPRIASSLHTAAQMVLQHGARTARTMVGRTLRLDSSGMVEVYLHVSTLTLETLQVLEQHGVQVLQSDWASGMVYATVAIEALDTIAALPFVRWISLPSYTVLRTGSVTSEGDTALRAKALRDNLGVDGSGVRIGILSDSLTDIQAAVATGDLPADLTIVNGKDGSTDPAAINEGRAIAEIIHDLAPGAALFFHSAFPTSLDTIAAIRALLAAGVHIIVDDVGFLGEPVFEDGPVAQAVREAINAGVVYVTAAGNDAQQHYQGLYKGFDPNDGEAQINLHDFGAGDITLDITIASGSFLAAFLQWPNPFNGSANTADYNLFVFSANGSADACTLPGLSGTCISTDAQLSSRAPPLETVTVNNNSGLSVTVTLVINRAAGAALPLSLFFNGDIDVLEHNITRGSIFGHPCVRQALAVGAIRATPNFATNALEAFSARGPCEIFFPAFESRTKPDLAAADGVATSLADFNPFFGTSAAAPHVAAIAALLIDTAGGPGVLSSTQIANILRVAAVDRGAPGPDNRFGHGAVDAVQASATLQALQAGTNSLPQSTIDAPAEDMVIAPGATVTLQGACTEARGSGPFTVAWDFGGAAAPLSVQSPGAMVFPSPGTFPVSFTCTDANGARDPTPATRTITVDQPPVSRIDSPTTSLSVPMGSTVNFAGSCSDAENHVPLSFLWFFGNGGNIDSSTLQNPGSVRFDTVGAFTVTFVCTDALGIADPHPATVQIQVTELQVSSVGGGGGGGGCSMRPGATETPWSPFEALGNLLLSLLVLSLLYRWRKHP